MQSCCLPVWLIREDALFLREGSDSGGILQALEASAIRIDLTPNLSFDIGCLVHDRIARNSSDIECGIACLSERLKENAAPTAEAGEALFLSLPIMTERLSNTWCYPAPTLDEQSSLRDTSILVYKGCRHSPTNTDDVLCCKFFQVKFHHFSRLSTSISSAALSYLLLSSSMSLSER